MNKITLKNYENENEMAIDKYKNKEFSLLNEYFYIQEPEIIKNFVNTLKNLNQETTIKEEAKFLTGFFWNQSDDEYTLAENVGKFFLRLESYKDDNIFIEIKDLSVQEKLNFVININYITENNYYLKNLLKLENQQFSEMVVEKVKEEEFFNQIKTLYCYDWINPKEMKKLINHNVEFIKNINLNQKLQNDLKPRNNVIKHKI